MAPRAARGFCHIVRNQTICQNSCRLGLEEGEDEGLIRGEIRRLKPYSEHITLSEALSLQTVAECFFYSRSIRIKNWVC